MEKVFRVNTSASPPHLFEIVSDLATFPNWIEVVHKVEVTADQPRSETTIAEQTAAPQWLVTLRAQLGPLARSKRLRMTRSRHEPPTESDQQGHVRFERAETDGRDHAEWTMEIAVGPADGLNETADQSRADCHLFYGGSMWSRLLDGQLDAVAARATERLQALADSAGKNTVG